VSKLIVMAIVACAATAAWIARSKGQDDLRGRAKSAGDRLREAESRVEDAIRS
jgi:hypothetical protein